MNSKYRDEEDSVGVIQVDNKYHWGAQTQRSLLNFDIAKQKMPYEIIKAIIIIKIAAAKINHSYGKLDIYIMNLIHKACNQILLNGFYEHFPLVVWQTGSGTQTNMNVNEVIASIANESATGKRGGKYPVHPNDHVNMSQSSNDVFPTAMHIATIDLVEEKLLPIINRLHNTLIKASKKWSKVVKIGRTHMQDATPITVGQEFSGYATQIELAIKSIKNSIINLYSLAQGGTAVGTGLNAPKQFDIKIAEEISKITGRKFKTASNKFEALASNDALVEFSGVLNRLAVSLMKIANDIRLLSSGPRCGFNELILPINEPGSSIMPGKTNPTQCEALTMVCAQVMGNNTAITIGASNGQLELNVFKPMIIQNIIHSIHLLSDASLSFTKNCVEGIKINQNHINYLKDRSLMLVTSLVSHIGYDKAAQIAKKAYNENKTLKQAAIESGLISEIEFNTYVIPENMV
ncbi:class II fumarate hydratase [Rickettsia endosymbiont of Cardiosporidium cionae]|uniref:class II fumarate hydratase n=1 Tax=Rickettsia endosymbiont of Cardiosporidium cionae TaxID=2777155 RepID=UPI0018939CBF|nr:class II fumarate hydratase [Rickettsia endosymbiont of Cardiosporidium cionae]KAF8818790.1 class II fumarate hydratase [Rickettsia endosymbiont of Cardiosporidium cionae]